MPQLLPAMRTMPRIAYSTFMDMSHIELKLGQLQSERK